MEPLVVSGTSPRLKSKLTEDDLDKLRNIATWTGSHDLYFIVKGHVEATLSSMDPVAIQEVVLHERWEKSAQLHDRERGFRTGQTYKWGSYPSVRRRYIRYT